MSVRAMIFDRDGTICREVGYVNHPDRLELMPGAAEVVRNLNETGWKVVVATNQAGVARGYFPRHVLEQAHERLREMLAREGAKVDAIYACPHHPDVGPPGLRRACECRKPGPGMLIQAREDFGFDPAHAFMIGDSLKDVGAGRAAECLGTVLLRTGYGRGEMLWKSATSPFWPDHVADDLSDAVAWCLRRYEAVHSGGVDAEGVS